MLKRFQYLSKEGIKWSSWFRVKTTKKERFQVFNKLFNEYKDEEDDSIS